MDKIVVGQLLEIIIDKIISQGSGIGRNDGMAVFVDGVLPGEIVQVSITKVSKNYALAELVKIKKSSKMRTPVPCPVYEECGGCVFQHTSYENQLSFKQTIISDAMQRIGKLDIAVELPLGTFNAYNYRNRVNYHVQNNNGLLNIGFYAHASHDLIPAQGCLLAVPAIRELAGSATTILNKYQGQLPGLRELVIRCNGAEDALLISLVCDKQLEAGEQIAQDLMAAQPNLISVWECSGKQKHSIYGDKWRLLAGEKHLPDELMGNKLLLSPATFSQVNHQQTLELYRLIKDFADLDGSQTILDLYSGAGTISLALADQAQEIIGVESSLLAVEDAKRNVQLNEAHNCRFLCEDVAKALPYLMAKEIVADVVILDPPRAGCDRDVLDAILTMQPKSIIYVSCAPATLARILRILVDGGYQTMQLISVDMFPQTSHIETVVLMSRIDK